MKRFALLALLSLAMSGCIAQGKLDAIQSGANTAQSLLENISVAPLMTCGVIVQQSQMILNKLATGTVIAPAIAPAPTTTAPPPVTTPVMMPSTGIPSTFPTGPVVTPK